MANIKGTPLNDRLSGTPRNDTIEGLNGNDFIEGRNGDDIIFGGLGKDAINGQQGNDTLYGGQGSDYLNDSFGSNILYGEEGDDNLFSARYGTNTLYGGQGNDLLELNYDTGNILYGEAGNDSLIANILDTGLNISGSMTGGTGNDQFSFTGGQRSGGETFRGDYEGKLDILITDFKSGVDKIRIDRLTFTKSRAFTIDENADRSVTLVQFSTDDLAKTAALGENIISYNTTNGNLFYDQTLFGTLQGGPTLKQTDIQPYASIAMQP